MKEYRRGNGSDSRAPTELLSAKLGTRAMKRIFFGEEEWQESAPFPAIFIGTSGKREGSPVRSKESSVTAL